MDFACTKTASYSYGQLSEKVTENNFNRKPADPPRMQRNSCPIRVPGPGATPTSPEPVEVTEYFLADLLA